MDVQARNIEKEQEMLSSLNSIVPQDSRVKLKKQLYVSLFFMRKSLKYLTFGVPVIVTFFDCIGYVAKVEGKSMQPALNPDSTNKDVIFLSRWQSRSYEYKKGDVVCILSPKNYSEKLVKRIIGLEGDLISTCGYKQKFVKIPPGHCWIEGDNTNHSYDSNLFGIVSKGLVIAKATHIIWPPHRWSKIESKIPDKRKYCVNRISLKDILEDESSNFFEE